MAIRCGAQSKTRWGNTHGRINGLIVLAILRFCLWKSFY